MKNNKFYWSLLHDYHPPLLLLPLDDRRWETMTGGFPIVYDPRPAFAVLERNENSAAAWSELWDALHHNGVVGQVSYAALPHLVRIVESQASVNWNLFGLACTIEVERHRITNPKIEPWLQEGYLQAWKALHKLACNAMEQTLETWQSRIALGTLALANGDVKLGALLIHSAAFDVDVLAEQYFAWSKLYISAANE